MPKKKGKGGKRVSDVVGQSALSVAGKKGKVKFSKDEIEKFLASKDDLDQKQQTAAIKYLVAQNKIDEIKRNPKIDSYDAIMDGFGDDFERAMLVWTEKSNASASSGEVSNAQEAGPAKDIEDPSGLINSDSKEFSKWLGNVMKNTREGGDLAKEGFLNSKIELSQGAYSMPNSFLKRAYEELKIFRCYLESLLGNIDNSASAFYLKEKNMIQADDTVEFIKEDHFGNIFAYLFLFTKKKAEIEEKSRDRSGGNDHKISLQFKGEMEKIESITKTSSRKDLIPLVSDTLFAGIVCILVTNINNKEEYRDLISDTSSWIDVKRICDAVIEVPEDPIDLKGEEFTSSCTKVVVEGSLEDFKGFCKTNKGALPLLLWMAFDNSKDEKARYLVTQLDVDLDFMANINNPWHDIFDIVNYTKLLDNNIDNRETLFFLLINLMPYYKKEGDENFEGYKGFSEGLEGYVGKLKGLDIKSSNQQLLINLFDALGGRKVDKEIKIPSLDGGPQKLVLPRELMAKYANSKILEKLTYSMDGGFINRTYDLDEELGDYRYDLYGRFKKLLSSGFLENRDLSKDTEEKIFGVNKSVSENGVKSLREFFEGGEEGDMLKLSVKYDNKALLPMIIRYYVLLEIDLGNTGGSGEIKAIIDAEEKKQKEDMRLAEHADKINFAKELRKIERDVVLLEEKVATTREKWIEQRQAKKAMEQVKRDQVSSAKEFAKKRNQEVPAKYPAMDHSVLENVSGPVNPAKPDSEDGDRVYKRDSTAAKERNLAMRQARNQKRKEVDRVQDDSNQYRYEKTQELADLRLMLCGNRTGKSLASKPRKVSDDKALQRLDKFSAPDVIEKFLKQDPKEIKSLEGLPPTIKGQIEKLMKSGAQISLKGSAFYQNAESKKVRPPSDLDMEAQIEGISQKSPYETMKWVEENFELKLEEEEIYVNKETVSFRSKNDLTEITIYNNRDTNHFTLTINDYRNNVDITVYDSQKPPPSYKDWVSNREFKLKVKEGGRLVKEFTKGYQDYVSDPNNLSRLEKAGIIHEKSDCKKDEPPLVVNPNARSLMFRLCFHQAIGLIKKDELDKAIKMVEDPMDCLYSDFGGGAYLSSLRMSIDDEWERKTEEERASHIKEEMSQIVGQKIEDFAKKHGFDGDINLKSDFTLFLCQMSDMPNAVDAKNPTKNVVKEGIVEGLGNLNKELLAKKTSSKVSGSGDERTVPNVSPKWLESQPLQEGFAAGRKY